MHISLTETQIALLLLIDNGYVSLSADDRYPDAVYWRIQGHPLTGSLAAVSDQLAALKLITTPHNGRVALTSQGVQELNETVRIEK